MRLGWELGVNIVEVAMVCDFLIRYFGYRRQGMVNYIGTALIGLTSFLIVSFFSWMVGFEIISTLLVVVVNFILCLWLLNGQILEKAFISAFIMALVSIVATATALLFSFVLKRDVFHIFTTFDPIRITAVITSKVVFLWLTRMVLRLKLKGKIIIRDFILLVIIPLCSMASMFFLMMAALRHLNIRGYIIGSMIAVAMCNVFVYYLFMRISAGNQLKQDFALLELQYACEQKNSVETQRLYEEMRAARHDLRNHLLCIDNMAAEQRCDEIQSYVQDFIQKDKAVERTILFTKTMFWMPFSTPKYLWQNKKISTAKLPLPIPGCHYPIAIFASYSGIY